MDIVHLIYFFEVARQKSFTKASQNLYISQSTISKLIKNLENELGTPLFYRTSKQVILTDAGHLLIPKVQLILNTLNSIQNEFSNIAGTPQGYLKIGIPPMIQTLFPKVIAEFKANYPHIIIDLFEVGSRKVEKGLSDGTLDVGIVVLPIRRQEEFNVVPFLKDPIKLIVHSNHPLAAKPLISLADLQSEPIVLYQEDFALHDHIIEKFRELDLTPKIMCETTQWDFMVDVVSSKLAIAFLPETICKKLDHQYIKSISLVETIKPWHLAIAWRNNTCQFYSTKIWLTHIFKAFGICKNSNFSVSGK